MQAPPPTPHSLVKLFIHLALHQLVYTTGCNLAQYKPTHLFIWYKITRMHFANADSKPFRTTAILAGASAADSVLSVKAHSLLFIVHIRQSARSQILPVYNNFTTVPCILGDKFSGMRQHGSGESPGLWGWGGTHWKRIQALFFP